MTLGATRMEGAGASPVTLRGQLPYVLNLWEGSFTTPIARARNAAVLGTLARVLKEMDPKARYEVVRADVLSFDYCLSDHRLQPNLVIAETIGRTEGLLLHQELMRIDPGNRVRYSVCHYGVDRARLVAQERHQDWDAMTEDEREAFIDEVVHED